MRGYNFEDIGPQAYLPVRGEDGVYDTFNTGGLVSLLGQFEIEHPLVKEAGLKWVIFYDAGNDPVEQFRSLSNIYKYCEDEFILVVDDANFNGVVETTEDFIKAKGLKILYERKILTSVPEDANTWWNGLYIVLLRKN